MNPVAQTAEKTSTPPKYSMRPKLKDERITLYLSVLVTARFQFVSDGFSPTFNGLNAGSSDPTDEYHTQDVDEPNTYSRKL